MRRKKIMHFSHHHPLRESEVQEKDGIVCSGCELDLSGSAYKCNDCSDFFLHKACFELPEESEHKSHPEHPLTLLSSPSCEFTCDACGDSGSAFNYYCSTCDYALHVKCASLPETVSREDHQHPITLSYSVLYDKEETELVCDVCDGTILDGCWVYCCSDCDFGTHLDCATTKPEEAAEEEEEKEKEKEEESGSKDAMAPMHALLSAQIEAQSHMQRLQFQMQASRQNAQFMHDISRSMVNLA